MKQKNTSDLPQTEHTVQPAVKTLGQIQNELCIGGMGKF